MRSVVLGLLGATAIGASVAADPVFLIVGNEDYDSLRDVRGADDVTRSARALQRNGATVISVRNGDAATMSAALERFGQEAGDADTLVVVLSGAFVHSATDTYFIASDAAERTLQELDGDAAYSLATIGGFLAGKPGRSFLVLGEEDGNMQTLNAFLDTKIGPYAAPQGVTVIRGNIGSVARFAQGAMGQVGAVIQPGNGLWLQGFDTGSQVIFEDNESDPVVAAPENDAERRRELIFWRRAQDENDVAGYQRYLLGFPNGEFADEARRRLDELTRPVRRTPEDIEGDLALSRDARREIQRDLSLLDYNTRGIDGIFGAGTRQAIRRWQGDSGFGDTGYLTAEQIESLDDQAARRAAELEAEARERRRQQLAEDRAYWDQTGARGGEDRYRQYLERYPDGEFADIAQRRLAEFEERRRQTAGSQDRELWDRVRRQDTIEAYRVYLDRSPNGAFRQEARQRIRELREANAGNDAAQREEDALNLNPVTLRVIEQRLEAAGFNPGRIDGVVDNDTRRAIRRYQASRNLPQTGYLTEAVVVRLLADSVRSIFD